MLRNFSPRLETATRMQLLDAAVAELQEEKYNSLDTRTIDYERYNLLYWLHTADPTSGITETAFKDWQSRHPEFQPREHPDLNNWTSFGWGNIVEAPVAEEIIQLDPKSDYQQIVLMTSEWIETAAQTSFDWSWQLVQAGDRGDWESAAVAAVISTWSRRPLDKDETEKAFTFLASNLDSIRTNENVVRVIPMFLTKLQNEESVGLLISHRAEFHVLFDFVDANCDDEFDLGLGDWLTIAINHPGGTTAIFLLHLISTIENLQHADEILALRSWCFNQCEAMLSNNNRFDVAGSIVLAGNLSFLLAVDSEWTARWVIPRFCWSSDVETARRAWHGYLQSGIWNERSFEPLLPYLCETFDRLADQLEEDVSRTTVREAFDSLLSFQAVYGAKNPMETGWLAEFVADAPEEDRVRFATNVRTQIAQLDDTALTELWRTWLHSYWEQRLDGAPRPLSRCEAIAMVEWLPFMVRAIPEALEITRRMAPVTLTAGDHLDMFHNMIEQGVPTKDPMAALSLISFLLRSDSVRLESWNCAEAVEILQSIGQPELSVDAEEVGPGGL